MDLKKLIKALRCNGANVGQDNNGCTNRKCKYIDADGACNIVSMCDDAATAIEELLARAEKAERERDAAIKWLKVSVDENLECYGCKWLDESTKACKNLKGKLKCDNRENNMWEWRGLEE